LTLVFLGGDVTWLVYQFKLFTGEGCGGNLAILIITSVLAGISIILVLLKTRNDSSVFTSLVALSYFLFLQWNAFQSSPNETCNPYATESAGNNF